LAAQDARRDAEKAELAVKTALSEASVARAELGRLALCGNQPLTLHGAPWGPN